MTQQSCDGVGVANITLCRLISQQFSLDDDNEQQIAYAQLQLCNLNVNAQTLCFDDEGGGYGKHNLARIQ